MADPVSKWSVEELESDAVSKKDIIVFLQESGSLKFLRAHKVHGKVANVAKSAKKPALIEAYAELFESKSFKGGPDDVDELAERVAEAKVSADNDAAAAAAAAPAAASAAEPTFEKETLKKGTGATPAKGDVVSIWYTGTLRADGKQFDTNIATSVRGKRAAKPLTFKCGQRKVVTGLDDALLVMKVGERASVTVPAKHAYGAKGIEGKVPPGADLVFEVELVECK